MGNIPVDDIEEGRKLLAEKVADLHLGTGAASEIWFTKHEVPVFFRGNARQGYADFWHPDADRLQALLLVDWMESKGFWVMIKSPFLGPGPLHRWHAGFTPHNTTGWNGRPDYYASGETFEKAIFNAALWWAKCAPELPPLQTQEIDE